MSDNRNTAHALAKLMEPII